MEILKEIIERHKELKGNSFIQISSFDDKKLGNRPYDKFFNIREITEKDLINEAEVKNFGVYGVFFNFNPLSTNIRQKEYIKKILYLFIDLDGAKKEHEEIITTFLTENNIKYSYKAQSGNGYHFLVPINLEITEEHIIKNFLNYIKNNICNLIDTQVYELNRCMRFPESYHKKTSQDIKLKTLEYIKNTKEDIENNSKLIYNFQYENKKGELDTQYLSTLDLEDIFFSEILNNTESWEKYYGFLKNSKDRNSHFIKNLGLFISKNYQYKDKANLFLKGWEASRIKACEGWIKKAKENNLVVNYYELFKWTSENNITEWKTLIKKQLNESFVDEIEFYYLEDEKPEFAFLIYYPKKNYYVFKNNNTLLETLYYEAQERGINLINFFNIPEEDEKGKAYSYQTRVSMSKKALMTKLDKEKRIKKVFNINYEPSEDKFIYMESKRYFNIYQKTVYFDFFKKESEYYFPHIEELILNLCGNDENSYNWFNMWLGWQIQNPTRKLPTAVIFQGRQGSGKGVFKNLILDNIFGSNVQEINQTHLESSFNDYLLGKQIIVANEVIHNENKALLPNVLKNLVTDPTLTISRKFKSSVEGKNYTHWIFCTNNDNPLKIDEDDRRYSVFYSEKLKGGEEHACEFVKELIINLEYELKQYISYLKTLEIKEHIVRKPIWTDAKAEIIELNKDSVDKFKEYLQQFSNLEDVFKVIYGGLDNYYIDNSYGDGDNYILTEKIYLLYEFWCQKHKEKGIYSKQNFSKKLSNKGCKALPKWKEEKTFRMYKISDLENLMKKTEK